MEKSIIATGKTIDLAIQAALNELKMDRDAVSVEVLENAKSGFLGIGASPAKVKVTYEAPDAEVEAWDISDEALTIARRNNDMLGGNVRFLRQNILTYAPDGKEHYDVIVSNPPYVTESEKQAMERNVLDWEPFSALFVPDNDPLLFYRRIAESGKTMLVPGGRLYFEINRAYGEATATMLCEQGYTGLRVLKDISGNDRIVIAER